MDTKSEALKELINDTAADYHFFSKLFHDMESSLTTDEIEEFKTILNNIKLIWKVLMMSDDNVDFGCIEFVLDAVFKCYTKSELINELSKFDVPNNKEINQKVKNLFKTNKKTLKTLKESYLSNKKFQRKKKTSKKKGTSQVG